MNKHLVNVRSQSVNVHCPTPHSGSRSGLGSRLPTAPPRTRPRLARRCALHARASRATVCGFEQVAGLQTDAKERVLGPLRDVLRRVALRAEEDETVEIEDELKAYLELPQLKCKTEQEAIDWWVEKSKRFPNLSAMARQYLGCPATSATVERLFSRVGIAFSAKRKSSDPATVADLMFANANLP